MNDTPIPIPSSNPAAPDVGGNDDPATSRKIAPKSASGVASKVASAAAAFALLGCTVGAGWLGWQVWSKTAAGGRTELLPRDPADHVQHFGYSWRVIGGLGDLSITWKPPAGQTPPAQGGGTPSEPPALEFHLQGESGYSKMEQLGGKVDYLTPEQLKAWDLCYRLNTNAKLAKRVGLSPEQVRKLQEMRGRRSALLKLTQPEKDRLAALFLAYQPVESAAEKAKAEADDEGDAKAGAARAARQRAAEREREAAAEKLEDAVEEVAREKVPAFRKNAAEMAAQVKALLSPEQMKKLEQAGK